MEVRNVGRNRLHYSLRSCIYLSPVLQLQAFGKRHNTDQFDAMFAEKHRRTLTGNLTISPIP